MGSPWGEAGYCLPGRAVRRGCGQAGGIRLRQNKIIKSGFGGSGLPATGAGPARHSSWAGLTGQHCGRGRVRRGRRWRPEPPGGPQRLSWSPQGCSADRAPWGPPTPDPALPGHALGPNPTPPAGAFPDYAWLSGHPARPLRGGPSLSSAPLCRMDRVNQCHWRPASSPSPDLLVRRGRSDISPSGCQWNWGWTLFQPKPLVHLSLRPEPSRGLGPGPRPGQCYPGLLRPLWAGLSCHPHQGLQPPVRAPSPAGTSQESF